MIGGSRDVHRACGGFLGPVGTSLAVFSGIYKNGGALGLFQGLRKKKNEKKLFIKTRETLRCSGLTSRRCREL